MFRTWIRTLINVWQNCDCWRKIPRSAYYSIRIAISCSPILIYFEFNKSRLMLSIKLSNRYWMNYSAYIVSDQSIIYWIMYINHYSNYLIEWFTIDFCFNFAKSLFIQLFHQNKILIAGVAHTTNELASKTNILDVNQVITCNFLSGIYIEGSTVHGHII